jgi:DNA-binding NtrC family response regulator
MTKDRPLKGIHVLVLEDDPVQALDLIISLEEAGASVLGPEIQLEEAERLITESCCDAAVIDLRLGNRNASAFAAYLQRKHIPFVVFSAYPDSAHWRFSGVRWSFVQKPASPDRVIAVLTELLELPAHRG